MDFFKELVELNNIIELTKFAEKYYEIDSDDEDEEIIEIQKYRDDIVQNYNKNNYRIFELKK